MHSLYRARNLLQLVGQFGIVVMVEVGYLARKIILVVDLVEYLQIMILNVQTKFQAGVFMLINQLGQSMFLPLTYQLNALNSKVKKL